VGRRVTLYLLRHGETEWNVQRRLQGQGDSALTERGLAQVRACAELLRSHVGSAELEIHMSSLQRTRHTAALLAQALGTPTDRCHASDLLRERYCGAWEGRALEDVEHEYGAAESERQFRAWDVRVGGDGETLAEVHARARAWLARPRASAVTIVVTHGIFSRTFRGAYLSLEPSAIMALPSHPHDRIYRLDAGAIAELS
jgi:broad specificity phosphatase PhoE